MAILLVSADAEYGHEHKTFYQAELDYIVKSHLLTKAYKAHGVWPLLAPPTSSDGTFVPFVTLQLPVLSPVP